MSGRAPHPGRPAPLPSLTTSRLPPPNPNLRSRWPATSGTTSTVAWWSTPTLWACTATATCSAPPASGGRTTTARRASRRDTGGRRQRGRSGRCDRVLRQHRAVWRASPCRWYPPCFIARGHLGPTPGRNSHLRSPRAARWLAFIDGDEFIMLKGGSRTNNIEEFMTDYEQYGGLALNW